MKLIDVEHDQREARRQGFDEPIAWGLHVWVGRLGLHLFLPDFWKSRPDWYRRRA